MADEQWDSLVFPVLGIYSTPSASSAAAVAAAAQDAAIAANSLALANITGQFIGADATYAALPVTNDTTTGDWVSLVADDVGSGTAAAPQYPAGVYVYDGIAYVFSFVMGGGSGVVAVSTIAQMTTPNAWYELTAVDAPAQPGMYWVSSTGDVFEAHGNSSATL